MVGYAESWANYVAEESGHIEFVQNAEFDRGFRKAWLGIENLTSHRSLYADIHRQSTSTGSSARPWRSSRCVVATRPR
jgi:hypothetical protein